MKFYLFSITSIFYLISGLSCAPAFIMPNQQPNPLIRVLISSEITDSLIITSNQEFTAGNIEMKKGDRIVLKNDSLFFKGQTPKNLCNIGRAPDILHITPKKKSTAGLKVGELEYRGTIEVRRVKGKILVINILPLEEYLYSVVGCEIGPLNEKNFESAKAQAVAARTYAVNRMLANINSPYHIQSLPAIDQAYKGKSWETELTRKAVDLTSGEILTHQNRPIIAYYHSTCGGVLNTKNKPYLKPLPDTPNHSSGRKPFCASSPHFQWELKLKVKEFVNLIASGSKTKNGKKPMSAYAPQGIRIKRISLDKEKKTKRVKRVRISTSQGNFFLSGKDFQKALQLKSNLFDIHLASGFLLIKGRGWGHGVGMCQSGAMEMARRGYSYLAILKHYYKRVKIKKLY